MAEHVTFASNGGSCGGLFAVPSCGPRAPAWW